MPYDPKNYSFGPTRPSDLRPEIQHLSRVHRIGAPQKTEVITMNFADLERRIISWMQMNGRLTGGPANQVGDHDPDYVPDFYIVDEAHYFKEKKDERKGMDSTRSNLGAGRGNVPAPTRRIRE